MNKFEEILQKLGATPELTKQFQESIDSYRDDVKSTLEEQYKVKLSNAKKVCVEEIEKTKADLCRKCEIFLEARLSTINREAQKAAAIGESDASKTLRELKALVEGVDIRGNQNIDQAAIAELKQLRVAVRQLKEASEKSEMARGRANQIALKVLQRNKILEGKFTTPAPKPTVSEAKAGTGLASIRTAGITPKTARAPITETLAKPAPRAAQAAQEPVDVDVAAIANTMDGDPAFIK
jgi:hypothetical protein